ncbi:dihydropteroate synthase [Halomicrobium salinisoli]|uniref:dihydropteroate synthase n=1 Tax=Halomicrobium salinisoli TaxID=2878391 RepID=UPI001CEFF43C|nr:dihydropteroate synthase [Halomicrobium salinisoli]
MHYERAVSYINELQRYPITHGSENVERLLERIGSPHEDRPFVLVTGSNGKGSTARMTSSILSAAGYEVGTFTSPHPGDVRKHVTVDGRKIRRDDLCEFVELIEEPAEDIAVDREPLTFFEVVTALAIWALDQYDVDIGVLEVGAGGESDATGAIDPVASAITSVSLEHTDYIGETIREIAEEKATVEPDEQRLVTGAEGEAHAVIQSVTTDPVVVGHEDAEITVSCHEASGMETAITISGPDFRASTKVPLPGSYQAKNAGVAAQLARQVGDVTEAEIETGLRMLEWPGRAEIMEREPLVVIDGAHNVDAARKLASTLSSFRFDDLHVVYGSKCTKDYGGAIAELPTPETGIPTRPRANDMEDPALLARAFERQGTNAVMERPTVARAVEDAMEIADDDDCVLITGSLSVVREARPLWTTQVVPKRIDSDDGALDRLGHIGAPEREVTRIGRHSDAAAFTTDLPVGAARELETYFAASSGYCHVGETSNRPSDGTDVVLSGTRRCFEDVADRIDDEQRDLQIVLEEVLDFFDADGVASSDSDGKYPWNDGTAVMGILNTSIESFYEDAIYEEVTDAVREAEEMVEAGAEIIDIGGESNRPGADPISVEEEKRRIVPLIEEIADLDALVSVDTWKAEVAEAALEAGADIINDVSGLDSPEMRHVVASYDVPIVLMHSINPLVDPDSEVSYDDVVEDKVSDLRGTIRKAERAGIDSDNIIIDPGLGFGTTNKQDFDMVRRLEEFRSLGYPVLVGHSRKSMFEYIDTDLDERLPATAGLTTAAVERGADIIRVHDVPENIEAVKVGELMRR